MHSFTMAFASHPMGFEALFYFSSSLLDSSMAAPTYGFDLEQAIELLLYPYSR